ncbi:MAG: hypothetical protein BGO41_06245 [Clostridiales bacterium 38-18]|nr:MAG: hypothetical protein BGO41_06245 [Clostridiales bacterium 38-18]
MNYVERIMAEIESRSFQLRQLRQKNAVFACQEVEKEIELLKKELMRYKAYESSKINHIYIEPAAKNN